MTWVRSVAICAWVKRRELFSPPSVTQIRRKLVFSSPASAESRPLLRARPTASTSGVEGPRANSGPSSEASATGLSL
jgi:hypothetical protein